MLLCNLHLQRSQHRKLELSFRFQFQIQFLNIFCYFRNIADNDLGSEIDILTELAELQVLLVQKSGEFPSEDVKESALKSLKQEAGFKTIQKTQHRHKKDQSSSSVFRLAVVDESKADDLHRLKANEFDPMHPSSSAFRTHPGCLHTALKVLKSCGTTPADITNQQDKKPVAIFDAEGFRIWSKMIKTVESDLTKLRAKKDSVRKACEDNEALAKQRHTEQGRAQLESKIKSIDLLKLKLTELRLWKKQWTSRQGAKKTKRKRRKEFLDKRRAWIKEQIELGHMDKSCRILVYTKHKLPFEPGFVASKIIADDNVAALIKGVHVSASGKVFPYKKLESQEQTSETISYVVQHHQDQEPVQLQVQQPPAGLELHDNVAILAPAHPGAAIGDVQYVDEFGNPVDTIIHYIQIEDPSTST